MTIKGTQHLLRLVLCIGTIFMTSEIFAGNDIVGIPGESAMKTVELDFQLNPNEGLKKPVTWAESFHIGWISSWNYRASPDGKKLVCLTRNGLSVYVGGKCHELKVVSVTSEAVWGPESRFLAIEGQEADMQCIYIVDTAAPELKLRKLVSIESERGYFSSLAWSPWGGEIYFVRSEAPGTTFLRSICRTRIQQQGSGVRKIESIVSTTEHIDFYLVPNLAGAVVKGPLDQAAYKVVFGTKSGLHLVDRVGGLPQTIMTVSSVLIRNIEWSPSRDKIVLYVREAFSDHATSFTPGVYLIHLQASQPKIEFVGQYAKVHTLWFSGDGKWVIWANDYHCWIRGANSESRPAREIARPAVKTKKAKKAMAQLPLKSVVFNEAGTHLAIAAGNQIWVHDMATQSTSVRQVFESWMSHFCAELTWRNDKLFVTVIEDIQLTGREPELDSEAAREVEKRRRSLKELLKRLRKKRVGAERARKRKVRRSYF